MANICTNALMIRNLRITKEIATTGKTVPQTLDVRRAMPTRMQIS